MEDGEGSRLPLGNGVITRIDDRKLHMVQWLVGSRELTGERDVPSYSTRPNLLIRP